MRKTIQTYLSGFEIERFSPVSMALWAAAMVLSLYTPHEENLIYLYEALLHIKAVLVCLLLGMLLIKILLLRKLGSGLIIPNEVKTGYTEDMEVSHAYPVLPFRKPDGTDQPFLSPLSRYPPCR